MPDVSVRDTALFRGWSLALLVWLALTHGIAVGQEAVGHYPLQQQWEREFVPPPPVPAPAPTRLNQNPFRSHVPHNYPASFSGGGFVPSASAGAHAGEGLLYPPAAPPARLASTPVAAPEATTAKAGGDSQHSYFLGDFAPDPDYTFRPYDGHAQIDIYAGKSLNENQRPLLELGRPYYERGPIPPSFTWFGETNLAAPRLLVYGDYRTAVSNNKQSGNTQTVWAHRLNLDIDLKLTSTERLHAFFGPLDRGPFFTRGIWDDSRFDFQSELDDEFDNFYFEGDAGAIAGGLEGSALPFDLPFAIGSIPLFFQNGIWLDDAFLGMAATLPARNSPRFDFSNYDLTFFYGYDKITSPAFLGDDNAAQVIGSMWFLEAYGGYFEIGHAYLHDRSPFKLSYNNVTFAYSRRVGNLLSSSFRVIGNTRQRPRGIAQTADGVLLLWENSLITRHPYTRLPYFNLFAGFGRTQSVARAANVGGILKNTGINFETDGLTNYPTLDDTGNDTWGGAVGLNLLGDNFEQQLIVEFAFLQAFGNDPNRNAAGDQYALGMRYQIPISNAVILRFDAMHGWLQNEDNVSGVRFEFRHKF